MTAAIQLTGRPPVKLRPGVEADAGLILTTWVKSFRSHSPSAHRVPLPVYETAQRALVEQLIRRSHVLAAVSPDDADQVFGWAALERINGAPILHFVYVKSTFRHFGIATLLLDALGASDGWATHHTSTAAPLLKARRLSFNPYLAGVLP